MAGYAVYIDYSFCSKSYLSLRLIPLVLMSRFFAIFRLASSAEPANSSCTCVGEELASVDDALVSVSTFYTQNTEFRVLAFLSRNYTI